METSWTYQFLLRHLPPRRQMPYLMVVIITSCRGMILSPAVMSTATGKTSPSDWSLLTSSHGYVNSLWVPLTIDPMDRQSTVELSPDLDDWRVDFWAKTLSRLWFRGLVLEKLGLDEAIAEWLFTLLIVSLPSSSGCESSVLYPFCMSWKTKHCKQL